MAQLKIGDRAPDFTATAHDGTVVRLADFRGKRGLVLFFYPKDNTAVCTQEACSFRDAYERFVEAGAQVVGVSSDSDDSHRAFAARHRLTFPLVCDASGELRKAYGASAFLGWMPGRVTFVIDRQGIIRLVYSAMLASDEHVQQALRVLQSLEKETPSEP